MHSLLSLLPGIERLRTKSYVKLKKLFGHAWRLKPIILSTREAEIRRIMVQGQPRQKVYKTSSQPMIGCGGAHRRLQFRTASA
jgi:hypothetical protein